MQSIQAPTCDLEECDRPVTRTGLCYGHYMKQWRYGDPRYQAAPRHSDLTGRRFGSLIALAYEPKTATTRASKWRCLCDCGTTRVRASDLNRGTVQTCGDVRHQLEPIVGYTAAHDRVTREHGPARDHACTDCGQPAAQWSYDHADPDERIAEAIKGAPPYSLKLEHYQARCIPCHKRFDLDHLAAA
jgi:hypothetical protein